MRGRKNSGFRKVTFESLEKRQMLSGTLQSAADRLLASIRTQEKTFESSTQQTLNNSCNELISQINKTISDLNKQIATDKKVGDMTDVTFDQEWISFLNSDVAATKAEKTPSTARQSDLAQFTADMLKASQDNSSKIRNETTVDGDLLDVSTDLQNLVAQEQKDIINLSTGEVFSYEEIYGAEAAIAAQSPQSLGEFAGNPSAVTFTLSDGHQTTADLKVKLTLTGSTLSAKLVSGKWSIATYDGSGTYLRQDSATATSISLSNATVDANGNVTGSITFGTGPTRDQHSAQATYTLLGAKLAPDHHAFTGQLVNSSGQTVASFDFELI